MKEKSKKTLGIVSIVLGCMGVAISFVPLLNILLCLFTLLSIVFAVISLINEKPKILGIIGLVLAIASIAITFLMYFNVSSRVKNVKVDGLSGKISARDIMDSASNNEAKFDSTYNNKQVNFKGKIESIDTNIYENGSKIPTDIVSFKEGWELAIPTGMCNLDKLDKGDKVEVSSEIHSAGKYEIKVYSYGYSGSISSKKYLNKSQIKLNGNNLCEVK